MVLGEKMTEERRSRVLVLEDDQDVLDIICDSLKHLDLDIAKAVSAEGMTKLISTSFFDTIILDNAMPDMTGVELVKAIRKMRVLTPVIFVSGGMSFLEQVEMPKLGAIQFLAKPFKAEELCLLVAQFISLGRKLSLLEDALGGLEEMGALSPVATDSFKHLLLDLLKAPAAAKN